MGALEKKPNGSEVALVIHTPMDLLAVALQKEAAIDVIERLAALQEKAMLRDAEMQFNDAMNVAQSELGRVAPNLENPQTHSRYASYAALDKVIRPIYVKHGFSLSFDTGDCPHPDMVRVVCYVSHRAGHTRTYRTDMPADGKGAKGGDVMTKTHATGAAMSYGSRYLLKSIFNIAVGEDDSDGNSPVFEEISERIEWLNNCSTPEELKRVFGAAYKEVKASKDAHAEKRLINTYEQKKKDFNANH